MRRSFLKFIWISAILIAAATAAASLVWSRRAHEETYRYRFPLNNPSLSLEKYAETVTQRLDKDADNFMEWDTLAELQMAMGRRSGDPSQFDKAVASAQKSLKIMPTNNAGASIVLAHVLEDQHQFAAAIEAAKAIQKENPNAVSPFSILVTSYLAQGDLPQAQLYADQYVERSPKAGALALRGLVLISAGRVIEGVFDLEKSFVIEDIGDTADSTWARCILARHFLAVGRLRDAEFLVDEALRISPDYPLGLDLKAQLLQRHGETAKAEDLFDRAFSSSHQVIYLRHAAELDQMTGRAQLANDRWTQAEKFIRVDLDKGLYGHRLELAKILLKRKGPHDLAEAVEVCAIEEKLRQTAEMAYLEAAVQYEMNDLKRAQTYIKKALRTGAREPRIYQLADLIFSKTGLAARGLLYRKLMVELDPDFNPANLFL